MHTRAELRRESGPYSCADNLYLYVSAPKFCLDEDYKPLH